MGFEVFLNSYDRGDPAELIPMSLMESVFGAAIKLRTVDADGSLFWRVEYEAEQPPDMPKTIVMDGREYPVIVEDSSDLYISVDATGERTGGFMAAGPAGNIRFYESLLMILQATHSALYWPGENSLVIGRADTREHLHESMIESLGEPFLVTHPEQIIERIRQS
ncbi:hypothetical protein [Ralstonia mannitolilytica]|uniref:hypothetical protein n=1 Tax=Ralstonia mannitolilytica TaxID=105219 RepID=UPI0028F61697|nr:hypothetical protein [Ralstonia mannitolilytica]CAJ0738592.1 hypothetical protein R76696_02032 [Ralstonia mannitolilytica]